MTPDMAMFFTMYCRQGRSQDFAGGGGGSVTGFGARRPGRGPYVYNVGCNYVFLIHVALGLQPNA